MHNKKWHVAVSGVLSHLYLDLDHIPYRNITGAFLFFVVVLSTAGQTSVLTQHNDNARTGQNTSETILNTTNVNVNQFGKLFAMPVIGQVYAQPLYVPSVTVNGGVHNVVIIATENDTVYAYDADSSGAPLWEASMVDAAHGAGTGETALNSATTTGCGDTQPQVGITSTPVIDPTSKTIYVEAKSTNGGNYFHRLHALDLLTGNEKTPGPVVIAATVSGTGDGSSNGQIVFNSNTNALYQLNRPGLLLLNGTIYIAYASHCDNTSHGWLFAYDAATFTRKSVYVTTPNGGLGGFWMSGAGVAADASGNIFIASGNGDFDMTSVPKETGDTILKLGTTNQILTLLDYFTPEEQSTLDSHDEDLGSGGVLLLPDQPGSFPHILVEAGKEGRIYVVNRDQMTTNNSHYCSGCPNDPEIIEESGIPAVGAGGFGMFNSPAYWNNTLYFWGVSDVLKSIPITNGLPDFTHVTGSTPQIGFPGAGLSVSSNGTTPGSAIVWAINSTQYGSPGPGPGPAVLYAYDANNITFMLYNSAQNTSRDKAGNATKFAVPTIANGKVYVGTSTEVDVYGLLPGGSGQTCPCTIWPNTATPGTSDTDQSQPVELGVKFTSSSSGFITGVRFYKGVNNTGTHVGNLWSSTGTLLASATFTGESASGWQQVNFSSPVAITANTVYVASYFSPTGDFAVDRNYFNTATTSPPLQALQNGASGPNAVYNYGSSSAFPTTSFSASNYWVDVVFNSSGGSSGSGALTIWPSTVTPGMADTNQTKPVELGVKFKSSSSGSITGIRFYKGINNTGTHVGNLWSSTGTLLARATFTGESASGWQQVNFSSPVAITANTVYVASYFSPTGDFSVDRNYFNTAVNNPPLQALQDGASGPNAVYTYGSSSAFPTSSYQASNYWVDVDFSQ
jgi:hypothetical protein